MYAALVVRKGSAIYWCFEDGERCRGGHWFVDDHVACVALESFAGAVHLDLKHEIGQVQAKVLLFRLIEDIPTGTRHQQE
jgi:hypothetical protein